MSYRSSSQVERKPARLIAYRGPRALVAYHNGQTYSMPSEPLKLLLLRAGDPFLVIITWESGKIRDVRAERPAPRREDVRPMSMVKVMVKKGRRVQTRR